MKESYVKHVILHFMLESRFNSQFEDGWIHANKLHDISSSTASEAFRAHGFEVGSQYQSIIDEIFARVLAGKGVSQRGDEYAGYWFRLNTAQKNEIIKNLIIENPASRSIATLPDAAFRNALLQIAKEDGLKGIEINHSEGDLDQSKDFEVEFAPGSDRIVSLSHNQISELEKETSRVIEAVSSLNSIDGDAGVRARLIGALKAGRELLRAGVFRLHAIEITLIEVLEFLVRRYERETIGAAAAVLLSALAKYLGIPS